MRIFIFIFSLVLTWDTNIANCFTGLTFNDDDYLDHNLFSILRKCLHKNEHLTIQFEKRTFIAHCRLCFVIRPTYYFINHSSCNVTPFWSKCRSYHHCTTSLSEVLIVIGMALITIPCASSDIDLVYNLVDNKWQMEIHRGYPFEMKIIQSKFNGDPLPFSICVDHIFPVMNSIVLIRM